MSRAYRVGCALAAWCALASASATAQPLSAAIDRQAAAVEPRLIAWRRDIHQNPELGGREVRTAKVVADHLRSLGLEVRTGVGGTGVVGVLRSGRPGPVVALRADMDALPVLEASGLPFASRDTGDYRGKIGPVMHACGHDAHVAILMATATVLSAVKADLRGAVVFIFQPAEEGPADFTPDGSRSWGARRMVEDGAMDDPKVDAIFGLHVISGVPSGRLEWRSGPTLASADRFQIRVKGRQTHGSAPWRGVDPITLSAQVILGLQTISSRQVDVTKAPSVITLGQIHGGARENIIPDTVDLEGTIRTYDRDMQLDIHERIRRTAGLISESGGGGADVTIVELFPPTVNDAALSMRMAPTLKRVMGPRAWSDTPERRTGSEDFPFFGAKAPSLYVHLGVTPPDKLQSAAANHSPLFFIDEAALRQGVRVMSNLAADYLNNPPPQP